MCGEIYKQRIYKQNCYENCGNLFLQMAFLVISCEKYINSLKVDFRLFSSLHISYSYVDSIPTCLKHSC